MIEKFFDKLFGKRPTKVLFEDIGNFSLIKEDNMKTIKIIDLYILIANEEFDKLPKKIKYKSFIFVLEKRDDFINYKPQKGDLLLNQFLRKLNDEVEILEDEKKIPEKIKIEGKRITVKGTTFFRPKDIEIFKKLSMEINEILDYLKSKGE